MRLNLDYVFSDADILIKLVRSELWQYFEQLISIRKWDVHIPSYILRTEVKNTDRSVYQFLLNKVNADIVKEIDPPVAPENPLTQRFSKFSRHVDNGEALVFALAESMKAIVLTDNLNDLKIIEREYDIPFKYYTLYQICYLFYKHKLRTEVQINKHISKLVESKDIRPNDFVIREGFLHLINKFEKENFD